MTEPRQVALVTGSSRGVGAELARLLGARGSAVVINCRDKVRRAEAVAGEVAELGGDAVVARADLTDPAAVAAMVAVTRQRFGHLDLLVLNASGGMERDVDPGYAMRLNRDAQLGLLDAALPLLATGSTVVFVTSHQAHFHATRAVPAAYEPVARSKLAGENALRDRIAELTAAGVRLLVVSGDMIADTITVKLLERAEPGTTAQRSAAAGSLITVAEFAAAILAAADDPELASGATILVGGADYLEAPARSAPSAASTS